MSVRFNKDERAAERGRESYWIDYDDRDRLGYCTLFQGEWHSDFRFNGKDFELRSETIDKAKSDVRTAIQAEVREIQV